MTIYWVHESKCVKFRHYIDDVSARPSANLYDVIIFYCYDLILGKIIIHMWIKHKISHLKNKLFAKNWFAKSLVPHYFAEYQVVIPPYIYNWTKSLGHICIEYCELNYYLHTPIWGWYILYSYIKLEVQKWVCLLCFHR